MSLEIQLNKKEIKSVFGGTVINTFHTVEHREMNTLNTYVVKAEVRFVDGFSIELDFNEVVEILNNTNDETLTDEAILNLCNDNRF